MSQNRFDLVIFDCDGVLVDSEPLAAIAYHNVYASQGMRCLKALSPSASA
jgi:beta-phosphoglucomutase-like phosphatase (HAD superfamily)